MRRLLLPLVVAVLLAGCGEDVARPTARPSTGAAPSTAPAAGCEKVERVQPPHPGATTDLAQQPAVAATDALPPCDLVVRDVVVGTGAEVLPGSRVEARYVGAFHGSGEAFDSSWRRGPHSTLPFEAGTGSLIPGVDQGVLGMRAGGRRELVVPSHLGYGPHGSGPVPPDAALVFVVDIVSVDGGMQGRPFQPGAGEGPARPG